MAPCRFFARDSCHYGASCRNSHDAHAPAAASDSSPSGTRILATQEGLQRIPTKPTAPKTASCWYFTQGKCKYGDSCKNIHDFSPPDDGEHRSHAQSSTPIIALSAENGSFSRTDAELNVTISSKNPLKPEAPSFTPKLEVPTIPQQEHPKIPIPCRFFARNLCRRGKECAFLHDLSPYSESGHSLNEKIPEQQAIDLKFSALSIQDELSQEKNGARVIYGPGAEVLSVKLASDFSSVQISGLAPDANATTVCNLVSDLGYPVEESQVMLKHLGKIGIVAEVRIENPSFAKDVIKMWQQRKTGKNKDVLIKPVAGTSGYGATGNRIQLSTITCTWHQASRKARLRYDDEEAADLAVELLEENTILDRVPDCSVLHHHLTTGGVFYIVHVSNLHPNTIEDDIKTLFLLGGWLCPNKITLDELIPDYSDSEAAEIIRELLHSKGELESFQHRSISVSNKVKATATFLDRDIAAEVVRDLHNTCVEALGRTRIFINHVVSVKYNVPTPIASALEKELEKLSEDIWRSGHVHLKVYPQTDPSKSFTAMRVFGENLKSVSGAKAQLERLLTGVVVMSEEAPLWDPSFLESAALADLNKLGRTHELLVYRDARKSQLLIFGGSVDDRNAVQGALIKKIETLRKFQHTIILTPQLLKKAMQGGMRKLKKQFGEAITLNFALNPKTITFNCSEEEFLQAQALLVDYSQGHEIVSSAQTTQDCVVCWTEATDPLQTTCEHTYCRDCFASQASSASDNGIPLRCFGEGQCEHVFSIEELKAMLSFTDFENLLQHSFNIHIRARPKDFQYCTTPDCPRVYRLTSIGEIFFCPACLTPVCTKCNFTSHEGMTCEEYKEINSEEHKLFQEYKKENDVRDCPNCKVGIQKSEGCNHMECMQCGTHICWFCMKTFRSSDKCYSHMTSVHGNYGEEV